MYSQNCVWNARQTLLFVLIDSMNMHGAGNFTIRVADLLSVYQLN